MPTRLLLILIPVLLVIGLTVITAEGADYLQQQPVQPDNTALWTALIASLVLNVLNFLSSTIGNVLAFLLKRDQIRSEKKIDNNTVKIDENTVMTKETKEVAQQTKRYVNGEFDSRLGIEKELSFHEGMEAERKKDDTRK